MIEMSQELWALMAMFGVVALSILFQGMHLGATAGNPYVISDRSTPPPGSSPVGGRLSRNVRNQVEGMILFIPLVLVSELAGVSNGWTQWAALIFICARALYVPFYAFGIAPLRTIAWTVGYFSLFAYGWGILSATYFA